MKSFAIVAVIVTGLLAVTVGCDSSSADTEQAKATAQALREAHAQIGMPAIRNFQERKLAKMIFELRDKADLVTYAYIVNRMEGRLVFLGKCIGFGLPYSVQYTNPMKAKRNYGEMVVTPQADPNGLFMPTGLSATWLMMIDPKTNEPRPIYVEPEIVVSPFPLH